MKLVFRQMLGERSALKVNAFYREYRDLIQTVSVTEAYPATYVMYGNRDFTTAKGFSFQYDMRRTGNVMMNAQYSLSFADGTGSGANSGLALAAFWSTQTCAISNLWIMTNATPSLETLTSATVKARTTTVWL